MLLALRRVVGVVLLCAIAYAVWRYKWWIIGGSVVVGTVLYIKDEIKKGDGKMNQIIEAVKLGHLIKKYERKAARALRKSRKTKNNLERIHQFQRYNHYTKKVLEMTNDK